MAGARSLHVCVLRNRRQFRLYGQIWPEYILLGFCIVLLCNVFPLLLCLTNSKLKYDRRWIFFSDTDDFFAPTPQCPFRHILCLHICMKWKTRFNMLFGGCSHHLRMLIWISICEMVANWNRKYASAESNSHSYGRRNGRRSHPFKFTTAAVFHLSQKQKWERLMVLADDS